MTKVSLMRLGPSKKQLAWWTQIVNTCITVFPQIVGRSTIFSTSS